MAKLGQRTLLWLGLLRAANAPTKLLAMASDRRKEKKKGEKREKFNKIIKKIKKNDLD